MKRIGDWLEVLGVNTLNQHLSYVTLRGARKRDHPQSFSYHEPWWEAYHVSAEYLARLSLALSNGEQVNKILVIEPTTSAWMYNTAGKNPPELEKMGETFQRLLVALEKAQVEYDIGCENVMARHGSVAGESLRVGMRSYRTVVLPPLAENLDSKTMDLLEGFVRVGGSILSCGVPPERVDGGQSLRGSKLAQASGWKRVDADSLPTLLLAESRDGFSIKADRGDKGILLHHRRQYDDGQLLFLVNTSDEFSSSGTVESVARSVERWDAGSGKIAPHPSAADARSTRVRYDLSPEGSLLLFLSNAEHSPAAQVSETWVTIPPSGDMAVRRIAPNVLTLDYVDVAAGGDSRKDSYFYPAAQFAFQKNGMERNPWDSAVQFRDELVTRKFPADSGFAASYHFAVRGKVPDRLILVVERPDLYTITCNGKPVSQVKDSWWLDRAFGKMDIAATVHEGENEITLKAAPFTINHEIEAVYLLGDFALKPVEKGFEIVPEVRLQPGPWNSQGYPFYSEGVAYTQQFPVKRLGGRFRISMPSWFGSVARVKVNGRPVGYVTSPPWQLDVTGAMRAGANTVEVVVIGTLKNTLGPHHGNPPLGTAWPAMFQKGPFPGPPPGEQYSTVGYGLMKPFELLRAKL
jgi:hypothetical protein